MTNRVLIGIEVRDYMIDEEMGLINNKNSITQAKARIDEQTKDINAKKAASQEKEKVLNVLINCNQKLRKDIKQVSVSLDKAISAAKLKIKKEEAKTSMITETKFESREIETANKQIRKYQKEIIALKQKLESSAAYDKYNELENKYKEAELKYKGYQIEISTVKHILDGHKKVISDYPKVHALYDDQINPAKEKLRALEEEHKKLKEDSKKQHNSIQDLESKYRKAIEDYNKRPSNCSESAQLADEMQKHKDELDVVKREQTKIIHDFTYKVKEKQKIKKQLETKLKELQKEKTLSIEKVAQLQNLRKSVKLNPLNISSMQAKPDNIQPNDSKPSVFDEKRQSYPLLEQNKTELSIKDEKPIVQEEVKTNVEIGSKVNAQPESKPIAELQNIENIKDKNADNDIKSDVKSQNKENALSKEPNEEISNEIVSEKEIPEAKEINEMMDKSETENSKLQLESAVTESKGKEIIKGQESPLQEATVPDSTLSQPK